VQDPREQQARQHYGGAPGVQYLALFELEQQGWKTILKDRACFDAEATRPGLLWSGMLDLLPCLLPQPVVTAADGGGDLERSSMSYCRSHMTRLVPMCYFYFHILTPLSLTREYYQLEDCSCPDSCPNIPRKIFNLVEILRRVVPRLDEILCENEGGRSEWNGWIW